MYLCCSCRVHLYCYVQLATLRLLVLCYYYYNTTTTTAATTPLLLPPPLPPLNLHLDVSSLEDGDEDVELEQVPVTKLDASDFDTAATATTTTPLLYHHQAPPPPPPPPPPPLLNRHLDVSSLGDAAEDVELEQVPVKLDTSDFDTGTTITTTTPLLYHHHHHHHRHY